MENRLHSGNTTRREDQTLTQTAMMHVVPHFPLTNVPFLMNVGYHCYHLQEYHSHLLIRYGTREPTWTVVVMVAEETLGVRQFSCGGNLSPPQHKRLLVEHAGMHEDPHEDRGQAVSFGRHSRGGRGFQREGSLLVPGDGS